MLHLSELQLSNILGLFADRKILILYTKMDRLQTALLVPSILAHSIFIDNKNINFAQELFSNRLYVQ
jgi:hypothetical protein